MSTRFFRICVGESTYFQQSMTDGKQDIQGNWIAGNGEHYSLSNRSLLQHRLLMFFESLIEWTELEKKQIYFLWWRGFTASCQGLHVVSISGGSTQFGKVKTLGQVADLRSFIDWVCMYEPHRHSTQWGLNSDLFKWTLNRSVLHILPLHEVEN